jgi:hypothetical protein
LAKVIQYVLLVIHQLDGFFLSDVVEPDNTIGDSLCLNELDPADLSGVIAMCTTASLGINAFNVNDSELISWNNTTLIEMETMLQLSLLFVHN